MLRVEREPRSGPCTLGRPRTRGAVRFAGPSSPNAACAVPASLPTPVRWQPRGAPHSARGPRGTSPGSVRSPRPARGVCFSLPGVRATVCPEVRSRGASRRTPVSQAVARSVSSRRITAGLPSGTPPGPNLTADGAGVCRRGRCRPGRGRSLRSVHFSMFSITPGFCPLDAGSSPSHPRSGDNTDKNVSKYCQMSPGERARPWLGTSGPDGAERPVHTGHSVNIQRTWVDETKRSWRVCGARCGKLR